MLKFPGNLTAEQFLSRFWQKAPLFMPQAIESLRPAITRNELAWLATLDDVESRLVFTLRDNKRVRYRVQTGPFDTEFLQALPKRDWSLLVHDVEKHLPAMRKIFDKVPFIPDWRIDDLMISFAAPGGGVGPHSDNYDVFLCQGIGVREWRYSTGEVAVDSAASDDLALVEEFEGDEQHVTRAGDVLYLPPGVAHWGTAQKACLTYSIGMRAPNWYADPDLGIKEVQPGYISAAALDRAGDFAATLGQVVTETKDWLQPIGATDSEATTILTDARTLHGLKLHGMARLAYDSANLYVNGARYVVDGTDVSALQALCTRRRLNSALASALGSQCLRWLLTHGAFELTETD